ncbi:MAG TPA: hypothetical protein VGF79_13245 [Bacteroidia bacterium]
MIYRFKVWFEEEEDINRVIDITPSATFLEFHNVVLDSIGFKKDMPSSFFCSDDNWRKGKEISFNENGKLKMSEAKLKDFVNDPHQKFIYITDFNEHWTLNVELQSIQNDVKGISYPFVFRSVGKAPKQNEGVGRFKIVDETEFDEIANKLVSKHAPMVDEDFDEEGFGQEGEDEEESDEFGETFGAAEEEEF